MYASRKIGDIAKVKGGKRVPKGYKLSEIKTQHPYIRARDIGDGRIDSSDMVFITNETYSKIHRYTVRENDVCITIAGNIGDVGIIPSVLDGANLTENAVKLIDLENCNPLYLKYSLLSSNVQEQMKLHAAGAAQPKLGIYKVQAVEIPFPPLPTQRKIAAILSAYDDLIENNTHRIQILEEMAQANYREWFVHYRFPGHEDVEMVDSGTELGEVPEGWKVVSISEIASIYRGKSYRSYELLEEGGLPFLNLKCVDRDGGFRQNGIKRFQGDFKETQSARPGDIIIALTDMTQERRIIARAARVPDTGENLFVMSMDLVKVISSHELSQSYLYTMLRYSTFPDELKEFANGVNVLHLSPKFIDDYKFPLPPRPLSGGFGGIADSIYLQIDNLLRKNANLRSTRDLLLPRLVSGQVDVSEIDIQVA